MSNSLAYQIDSTSDETAPCGEIIGGKRVPWREEIIGGEVVAMAPGSTNHNRVKFNISLIFGTFLRGKPCEFLPDGVGLYLAEDEDEFIPDGMIVCDPDKIQKDGVHGAPDLVVEVLSPGTARYDKGRKKDMYEKHGVREYWIVSPDGLYVEQYVLTDGRFVLRDIYYRCDPHDGERMNPKERAAIKKEFQCSLYDDLTIRVDDIFERVA